MAATAYSVVIIGAGPTGLSLAIELGHRGVNCLVVERNDRVGYAPRAKTTNIRTRTHMRRWGIADRLAAEAPHGVDYPSHVVFVTRLGGQLLARIENHSYCKPERNPDYPEHGQWIPQYKVEKVLREHVAELPSVEIVFNTEFEGADQDDNGVSVRLRDTLSGEQRTIGCHYLVGADGGRSAVRTGIGASMEGRFGLSRNYNIVFRAPGLAEAHPHGPAAMYWQTHPDAPSLIGPMDSGDIWFFMPTRLPENVRISDDEAVTLIQKATGIDLPYEIMSSDEWVANALMATSFSDRRIFLAGDACHLHPPFGGHGMNMGVSDAVDLGWKLAAVLQGWGAPALLESYEPERRQVHQEVIAEAESNHTVLSNDLWRDDLEDPGPAGEAARTEMGRHIIALKDKEFHALGTVLGRSYTHSPVITYGEGGARTPSSAQNYEPSSLPGCLAPHIWRSASRSLYDQFGLGFALICRPEAGPDDIEACAAEARRMGCELSIVHLTRDEAADLYPARLTLVRPDQHVVWRGESWTSGVLDKALGWRAAQAPGLSGAKQAS